MKIKMDLELDSRFSFLYHKITDFENEYGVETTLKFKDDLLEFKRETLSKYYILLKRFDDFEYDFLNSVLNGVIKKSEPKSFDNVECMQIKKNLVDTFFKDTIPQWFYQQPKLEEQEKLRRGYRRRIGFLKSKKR